MRGTMIGQGGASNGRTVPNPAQVTVIIPAYNVAPFIGEALASVIAQTREDWRAIVIDDGSPDDVAAAVAPFLGDPRISMMRTENRGLAAARNLGIASATTPYVAMLDGDDRYRPDYLEQMLARIEQGEPADFVTCDAISFGMASRDGERFSARYQQSEPITLERLLRREVAIFGLCTLRVAALAAVGGYDESLGAAEDLDLWLRLLGNGATARLVDRVLVEYRRRSGSLSHDSAMLAYETARAFGKAQAALGDRPEAGIAAMRARESHSVAEFEQGIDRVLSGDARKGVAQIVRSSHKAGNGKWTVALAALQAMPVLARPVLAIYRRRVHSRLSQLASPNPS